MTLTTAQAAERLHITPDTVRRMARDGRIAASYIGRQWLITEQALADHLEQHSNRERRPARRRRRRAS